MKRCSQGWKSRHTSTQFGPPAPYLGASTHLKLSRGEMYVVSIARDDLQILERKEYLVNWEEIVIARRQ